MIKVLRPAVKIPNSISLMLALFFKTALSINRSSTLSTQPLSIASKRLTKIAILVTVSFLSMPSAYAEHDHGHGRGDDHGHGGGDEHGDWHDRGRGGYGNGYGYSYAQPVYAPPPVYITPLQSPGINLVLPINFR